MSNERETVDSTTSSPKKLSAVGGAVGTALGARRGPAGAFVGAFVGGTLGYLTGASLRAPAGTTAVEPEPVAIDVAEPESGDADLGGGTDGDETER